MAKRLSNNPASITTQIETSEALIVTYKADLERTPLEDEHGCAVIQKDLREEQGLLGKLNRHLDGLETEFGDLFEAANVTGYGESDHDQ